MNAILINNLSIKYGEHTVISNFSACIPKGQFTAIMGESGCGKTSICNALLGLIPFKGEILFSDTPCFSVVFQENRLCETISVLKNLRISTGKEVSSKDLTRTLLDFGLDNTVSGKKIHDLSGGMKRRVSIIRALLAKHNLLILDEPFTGLDEDTKYQVMEAVKKMTSKTTVILITHDISEAKFFNSNIISIP